MSQYYEIALDCGTDKADATQSETFLGKLAVTMPTAFVSRKRYPQGETWVNLCIPWNELSEAEWTTFLMAAWQMPLFELPFRFAIAGFDVDLVRTYEEMREETNWNFLPHIALSDALWQAAGRPQGFTAVGLHYVRG